MTPKELRETLENADKTSVEMGLDKPDGIALVWITDKPPQGYKIRTPFGNCDIMNCQQKGTKFQTVFRATRKQIINYLKKCEAAA